MKFPVDAPRSRVVKALQTLRFQIVREREHIAMRRTNADGTTTPLTLPNHTTLKGSTLRAKRRAWARISSSVFSEVLIAI